MRVLVTGGRGFVGAWLDAHLTGEGDDVTATGEEVDVTDPNAVRQTVDRLAPEAIYHLAGQAHVGKSWESPGQTFEVNVVGTVNVLDAARRVDPHPTVLVVSSAEVYGKVEPSDLPLRESSPTRPMSPYAASKLAAEVAAEQAVRGGGVPVVIARPFNHIGPGQSSDFVVSALARRIVDAERSGARELHMGNATPRRDLTDVRDVVRAYRLLVQKGERGEVYNVASGADVAIGALARQLIELSGAALDLVTDSVDPRPVDVPVLLGDSQKLRDATGWRPEIPRDRSLLDVLAYWRAQPG